MPTEEGRVSERDVLRFSTSCLIWDQTYWMVSTFRAGLPHSSFLTNMSTFCGNIFIDISVNILPILTIQSSWCLKSTFKEATVTLTIVVDRRTLSSFWLNGIDWDVEQKLNRHGLYRAAQSHVPDPMNITSVCLGVWGNQNCRKLHTSQRILGESGDHSPGSTEHLLTCAWVSGYPHMIHNEHHFPGLWWDGARALTAPSPLSSGTMYPS